MRIMVTGTPGTGKTGASKELALLLQLPLTEVNRLVRSKRLYSGKESGSLVLRMKPLERELRKAEGVIEGHVLCDMKLKADYVFVLRCNPKTIERRLAPRGYSRKKVRDNLEAEALDYCLIRAKQNYKNVFQIDTTRRTARSTAKKMADVMRGGSGDDVDFSAYILSLF